MRAKFLVDLKNIASNLEEYTVTANYRRGGQSTGVSYKVEFVLSGQGIKAELDTCFDLDRDDRSDTIESRIENSLDYIASGNPRTINQDGRFVSMTVPPEVKLTNVQLKLGYQEIKTIAAEVRVSESQLVKSITKEIGSEDEIGRYEAWPSQVQDTLLGIKGEKHKKEITLAINKYVQSIKQ